MQPYRKILVDLLLGLLVGFIINLISNNLIISAVGGLLTFFLAEFIDLKVHISKHTGQIERLNELWQGFLKPSDIVSELAYEYGFKQSVNIANDTIQVSPDQVWPFWRDCLLKAKTRWTVVSYVDPNTWWNIGTVKPTLATQKERIEWGCHIERLFCVDSDAEIEGLRETMRDQSKAGIQVGVIRKEKLLENNLIAKYARDLGTLDIALVDDKYVYRTHIDKHRKLTGASLTRDHDVFEKASYVIDQARAQAVREMETT